jgi:predicted PurR-regulated permease PerM
MRALPSDGHDPLVRIAITLRALVLIAAIGLVIWALADVLLLIFLAVLIGALLRGSADWLSRRTRLHPSGALAVVSVVVLLAFVGLLVWAGPRFVSEGTQLWHRLSQSVDQLRSQYGQTTWGHYLFVELPNSVQGAQSSLAKSAANIVTSTVGTVGALLVVIVTALYFAIEPGLYVGGVVRLFPVHYRPRAREILIDTGHTLQWWLLGQGIDMLVVGVLSGVGLLILGVPLAFVLAVLAGLFTFVPYFGAIAAGVPAVLMALTISWTKGVYVVLVYLVCHLVEGYIIAPIVQRRTVRLAPALTILAMAILGAIFGSLGLILATPLTAAILTIVKGAYVADVLEKHAPALGERGPVAERSE